MKVVYVTGCLGFIGSYVTKTCLDLGWYVKGVDKITYAANKDLLTQFKKYPNFSFVHCDINDLKFLYDCDYVINTAAETHVGNSIANSDDFVHSNVNGVHNLLELIKNHRGENISKPTLLHFSTDEVYGDIEEGEHIETDILKPSNPYSATKAAADMLVMAWGRTYGLPYIIVRPTNNYGIGQYVEKLIPKTCKYLKLGRKVPLHNNGTPIRNWLHAQDTADAIVTIINAGIKNEIYNICGGFEQNNLETVKKICILDNKNLEDLDTYIDFTCVRPGQDVRYALNDSKLQRLGWKPKKEFDNELPPIVQHYRNKFIW
jgi:dTDP-glucose 4,6-dehydratase